MANHLTNETSPYLLQHAENPVDWFPWSEEALNKAKQEDKPILLSIGYSSCHWCHVMAHESFEDQATAQVMNQYFINIKVDREERPDLDKIYQQAFQMLNSQGGGWPLTMFLDPETLLPFFGGTYFPKNARYQLPGFVDLLMRINDTFTSKKGDLKSQGDKLRTAFEHLKIPIIDPQIPDKELLDLSRKQLEKQYDSQYGGFSSAPKFPTPAKISKLLIYWAQEKKDGKTDKHALEMVMTTLTQIARGGIYDHIGGGFCRYSTDKQWMIPHFEKMLYDNGQLLSLLARALQLGPDQLFQDAISQTIDWLSRDLRHPKGGFFSSVDADSNGEEGVFYAWRREELKKILTEDQYLLIETLYGIDKPANFENKWIFHRNDSWRSVVNRLQLEPDKARETLSISKEILFKARKFRVAPQTDDKILTSWNALAIKGILESAHSEKNREDWVTIASDAIDFIHDHLWDGKTLFATWKDDKAKYHGYLDDYANLLDALLMMLKTVWREKDAQLALKLADSLLEKFYDENTGGFFFTAHEQETLFTRPKPTMDHELPSGNGIASSALSSFGILMGNHRFIEAAEDTLKWARLALERLPTEHSALLESLQQLKYPPQVIILRGPDKEIANWKWSLSDRYAPQRHIYCIPYSIKNGIPPYLPGLISAEKQQTPLAYVCQNMSCSLPISSLEELKSIVT